MPLYTSIVYKKTINPPTGLPAANGLGAWGVKIEVIESTNISPKIFVYHRGPQYTRGAVTDFDDVFYSVASVAEMQSLPEDGPNANADNSFYRTEKVELIFDTEAAATQGVSDIEELIRQLDAANNLAINDQAPEVAFYPENAVLRYWGISTLTSLNDAQIAALNSEPGAEKEMTKTLATSSASDRLYIIYRTLSGPATDILVDGNSILSSMTMTQQSVTNALGHVGLYNVYRSATQPGGSAPRTIQVEVK